MDISDGYKPLNVTTGPRDDSGPTVWRTLDQREDRLKGHQEHESAGNTSEKSDETQAEGQTKCPREAGEDSNWMQVSGRDEPADTRTCPGCDQVMENDYSLVEHLINPDNVKCYQAAQGQDEQAELARTAARDIRNKAAVDAWYEQRRIDLAPPSAEEYARILGGFYCRGELLGTCSDLHCDK